MQQILKMRHIFNIMLSSVLMLLMAACNERSSVTVLEIEPAGHPSGCNPGHEAGVSAPYCGVIDGYVIFAGGANFPDIPAKDGGRKRFYSDILSANDGEWTRIGELPKPAAYGGSVCMEDRLLLLGGNDGEKTFPEVYSVGISDGKPVIEQCTPLPYGIEQAGYAKEGNRIYIAGGLSAGNPFRKVMAGTMEGTEITWTEIADMPEAMVQPVALACNGRLYVWGGFDPEGKRVSDRGWCLEIKTGEWRNVDGCPDGKTLTGASGTVLKNGSLAIIGGVDNDIFHRGLNISSEEERIAYMTMEPAEYRFNTSLRIFNPETEEWSVAGRMPQLALAGAGIAADDSYIYIIGGELKPGIRTPDTWKLKTETR